MNRAVAWVVMVCSSAARASVALAVPRPAPGTTPEVISHPARGLLPTVIWVAFFVVVGVATLAYRHFSGRKP